MTHNPTTIAEVQAIVRAAKRVLPRGGGTKPALSTPTEGVVGMEMRGLAGLLEYQPEEYTFTALAGTPLRDLNAALAEQGQYLPFDPPLARRGATLGGTVAAGLSGPGRYHFGGLRDFLLGVSFIDSRGRLVRGGGKVVKNAAGFDLPKLMVGSLGSYGVLVELTFKVFPRLASFVTLRQTHLELDQAMERMAAAARARVDLDALDLQPDDQGYSLWIRLGGFESTLLPRLSKLEKAVFGGETLRGDQEQLYWEETREFSWIPAGWSLVKLPLTPGRIRAVEASLANSGCSRRYSVGGQVAWIALDGPPAGLESLICGQRLSGLVLWGPPGKAHLGEFKGRAFYERIKSALDPERHFVEA
jgi:glycolate oxidase FAD binding subunit